METQGIHHITAIAGDPRRNLEFYRDVLGLRLVKQTVNFDDPSTYHLYFGDRVETPGTLLTFFPWVDLPKGRAGAGSVSAVAFSVPSGSLDFWKEHLEGAGVVVSTFPERFGERGLRFSDPDGLALELVEVAGEIPVEPWETGRFTEAVAIRGFHGVTALVRDAEASRVLLETALGWRFVGEAGSRLRFEAPEGGVGRFFDFLVDPEAPRLRPGTGTVHHIAFGLEGAAEQEALLEALIKVGVEASPVIDRTYFRSIYFREPSGILYEGATDGPGFLIDEPEERLGEALQLPERYAGERTRIEANLPSLD